MLFSQVPSLQTETSSGNVENAQLRFGSPRGNPFFDPSPVAIPVWVSILTAVGYNKLASGTTSISESTLRSKLFL